MSNAEEKIAADRHARAEALGRVTSRFSAMKGALAEKGIGQRAGDLAAGKAKAAAQEAVMVAKDSKALLGGTAGLLALWFLRKPIAGQAQRWWPRLMASLRKENDA